jgi:hypothetical protein
LGIEKIALNFRKKWGLNSTNMTSGISRDLWFGGNYSH